MNLRAILVGVGKGLGWALCFLVLVIWFSALGFPEDRAREFVEIKGSEALGGDLRVGAVSISGLYSGAEISDLSLRLPAIVEDAGPGVPIAPPEGADDKRPPRMMTADRLDVEIGRMALALGSVVEASAEADLMGGAVRGIDVVWPLEGGESRLKVERIEGVRLGPEGLFKGLIGFDVRGVLGGTLDVKLHTLEERLGGEVDIALSGAKVVKPMVPTRQLGPITLSDIELGELQVKVSAGLESEVGVKKGRARRGPEATAIVFTDVGASGEDVELQIDEKSVIRLSPNTPFDRATMDVHLAVHFKDSFYDKKVKGEDGSTSQPNKILRMALQQDAKLRASVRDGVLGIACRGLVSKPDCRLEPPRVRGFKKRKPRFSEASAGEEDEEPEEEATAEEGKGDEPRARKPKRERRKRKVEGRPPAGEGARRAGAERPNVRPEGAIGDGPGRAVTPAVRSAMEPIRASPMGARNRPIPKIQPSPSADDEDEDDESDDEDDEEEEEDEEEDEDDEEDDDEDDDEDDEEEEQE